MTSRLETKKGTKRAQKETPAGEPPAKRAKKASSSQKKNTKGGKEAKSETAKVKAVTKSKATSKKAKASAGAAEVGLFDYVASPSDDESDTVADRITVPQEEDKKEKKQDPLLDAAYAAIWAKRRGKVHGDCTACGTTALIDKSQHPAWLCFACFFAGFPELDPVTCTLCDEEHMPADCPTVAAVIKRQAEEAKAVVALCWSCDQKPEACKCPWNKAVTADQTLGLYLGAVLARKGGVGKWLWPILKKLSAGMFRSELINATTALEGMEHEPTNEEGAWACSLCSKAVVVGGYCSRCDAGCTKCRICTKPTKECKCDWRCTADCIEGLRLLVAHFIDAEVGWEGHESPEDVLNALPAKQAAKVAIMMAAAFGAKEPARVRVFRQELARAKAKKDTAFFSEMAEVLECCTGLLAEEKVAAATEYEAAAAAVSDGDDLSSMESTGGKGMRFHFHFSEDEEEEEEDEDDETKDVGI